MHIFDCVLWNAFYCLLKELFLIVHFKTHIPVLLCVFECIFLTVHFLMHFSVSSFLYAYEEMFLIVHFFNPGSRSNGLSLPRN